MFHVSRFLCALACSGLSSAIRRGAGVVGQIGSLIDAHQTPRVEKMMSMIGALDSSSMDATDLNATIDTLLATIKTSVVDVILSEQSDAASTLTEKFNDASAKVSTSATKWEGARGEFETFSDCVAAERGLAGDWKASDDNVSDYNSTHIQKVSEIPPAANSETLESMEFSCDASVEGECEAKLVTFEADVARNFQAINSSVLADQADYDAKVAAAGSALQDLTDAISVRTARNDLHARKVEVCNGDKTAAETSFCGEAAVAEEQACAALAAFDSLVEQVSGSGNAYSVSDRGAEYNTIMQVHCFLRKLKGIEADCTQSFDMAGEGAAYVAVDYRTKERAALQCKEATPRSVEKLVWTRPQRAGGNPVLGYSSTAPVDEDLAALKGKFCQT